MSASNSGRSLSDEFPLSNNYKALLLGALYYAGITHVDFLTLGLPVHTMSKYAEHLKTIRFDDYMVNGQKISVGKIIVIPQPVGSLAMFAASNQTIINNGETRLILDPGYVTTDWVVAQGYKMVNSRSGGRMGGVSNVYKNIASLIAKKFGQEQFGKIERIDQAFVTGKDFRYYGKVVDQTMLQKYLTQSSTVIEEIVSDIKARVGDTEDIDAILIAGGGAHFLRQWSKNFFHTIQFSYWMILHSQT
jgi:plasmid segregation protein ParM